MNELGFGPIDETSRHLVMAPAKTPRPILDLLAATLGEVLHEPGVQRALYDRGFDLSEVDYTPAEADALIQSQYAQWGPFLKTLDAIN
jgi:tripartite-type tricarboxylate transporter receptor subunit TctC